jgi:hypothetical protein
MDEMMYVTFVSLVLAFAVGLTAVGSVSFYMAEVRPWRGVRVNNF